MLDCQIQGISADLSTLYLRSVQVSAKALLLIQADARVGPRQRDVGQQVTDQDQQSNQDDACPGQVHPSVSMK